MTKFLVKRHSGGHEVTDEVEADGMSVENGMLLLTSKTVFLTGHAAGAIYSPGSWVSVRSKPTDET